MLSGMKQIVGMGGEALQKGDEEAARDSLLGSGLVFANSQKNNTSEAQIIKCNNKAEFGVEAFALWPGDMEVAVPENWKAGDKVPAQGPHGRILLELPEGCEAGKTLRYRLRPEPELRVEVPPGAKSGGFLTFDRPDGTRIEITVPPGKQPGEQFEVTPPALMVIVPEGAQVGDSVIFGMPGPMQSVNGQAQERLWFRAEVPQDRQLGRYFAARLPPPEEQNRKAGNSKPKASQAGAGNVQALE